MKKLVKFIFIFCGFALVLSACKTEEDPYFPDSGEDYFPLEIGKYWIYAVDSTVFDPTGGDTMVFFSQTFVKDEILDTLSDNLGNTLFRTERSERKSETETWQTKKVFTQSIQNNQAIRTEDNLRFIKLAFPLRRNNTWDGLVHFDAENLIATVAGESIQPFKNWGDFRLLEVGEADTVGTFIFDEVTTLREADDETLIELRFSREKYARGVGLVHKEMRILDTQKCQEECQPFEAALNNCISDCLQMGTDSIQCVSQCAQAEIDLTFCQEECNGLPWEEKAQKGFIFTQTLLEHN